MLILNIEQLSELYSVKNDIAEKIIYVKDFITEEEEENLLTQIYDAPKPKWKQLSHRRLQYWGGIPPPSASKAMVAEKMPDWLDAYCAKLGEMKIFDQNKPNHVLINEYLPGQGIMPHQDGNLYFPTVCNISLSSPLFLDFYRPIQVTNIGEALRNVMQPSPENDENGHGYSLEKRYMFSILMEPRSLLILKEDMFNVYLHGIKDVEEDRVNRKSIINYERTNKANYDNQFNEIDELYLKRSPRVSLTIRYVPNVVKPNPVFLNTLLNKNYNK